MLVFNTLFLLAVGYALARGGWPERTIATVFILARLSTFMVLPPLHARFHAVSVPLILIDVGVFVACLAVALRADRYWPLLITAMQGVSLLAHGAELYADTLIPQVYLNAVQIWAYPELILLLIGALRVDFRRYEWKPLGLAAGCWPLPR